jgi:transcriptional regulator with XRE-family HTH domain
MKLHQTTMIELDDRERAVLRAAGDRWAEKQSGNSIRTGRIKRVSAALGIGPETLRQWENGLRKPTWAKLEAWCSLLDVAEIDLRVGLML